MVQGVGKEYVFPDDQHKGFYLACLQKHKEKHPVKILAFCVMGNHAHILLSVDDVAELSQYMKIVNQDYAQYYNRVHSRVGYVFRSRFKSEVIRSEKHLVYCVAYIQNNPLKAHMVQRAEDYGYSSYSNYLRRTGIVDFNEAANFYDTSPEYMAGIMAECTDTSWLEHEDGDEGALEKKEKVFAELVRDGRFVSGTTDNVDLTKELVLELIERCGSTIKEIAELFGIGREALRRRLKQAERADVKSE